MDQRRLIKSYRPRGPATPFITTENVTLRAVCGKVAIAQMASTTTTSDFCGTTKGANPVKAKAEITSSRERLNHGTICRRA